MLVTCIKRVNIVNRKSSTCLRPVWELFRSITAKVCVSEGFLEGVQVKNEFRGSFYSFKGIPYAEPPLGDLRFKAPQPKTPWKGVRSAMKVGLKCFQANMFKPSSFVGSEDCLYLNVYTPDLQPDKPLPVMFWIHGGAFVSGSGSDYTFGPDFLIRHGVVLVTINYRLEALGFLCLDTEEVPGNAGIKDQVAAMRWVNKNIANFGGDPNNVTIFGQSAGGASVGYHMVSPMTKGLFKRAILQSGCPTCWWAETFEPRERALRLAKKLGCNSNNDTDIYNFFKNQSLESLANVHVPVNFAESAREGYETTFGIVSEKQFEGERYFHGDLFDMLPQAIHEGVEVMTGYNTDDGVFIHFFSDYEKMLTQAKDFAVYFTPKFVALNTPVKQHVEIGRKIQKFYMDDPNSTKADWERLVKFHSMDMFSYGPIDWAKICANKHTVYFYKFSCKSERNITAHNLGFDKFRGDKIITCHSDELYYLFHTKLIENIDVKSKTFEMIENTTKLWTNFAKYGNPTPDDTLGVRWKPYSTKTEDYMDIGNVLEPKTKPDYEEVQFWEDIFRQYAPKLLIR